MTRINGAGHHRAERHCAAMIKIRYRDANEFCPGLHATADRHGRIISVYLLPGLTAEERKAAFRRLRLSGRRGCGPELAAPQLAFALLLDRIRTAAVRAGSVFRRHPAGTTGPVMLVSAGAIAFLVLSAAVSVHILRQPRQPLGSSASGSAPAASALAVRLPDSSPDQAGGPAGSQSEVLTSVLSAPDPLPVPTSHDSTGTGSTGTGTGSTGTGGTGATGDTGSALDPTASPADPAPSTSVAPDPASPSVSAAVPVSVSASVAPVSVGGSGVSASVPASVSASLAPSVSVGGPGVPSVSATVPVSVSVAVAPSVSASSASATGGACLDVGPLGICLNA